MKKRIQQQISDFRKVLSDKRSDVNIEACLSKEDSLSKAIRTEKDAKKFMSDLKEAIRKAM